MNVFAKVSFTWLKVELEFKAQLQATSDGYISL